MQAASPAFLPPSIGAVLSKSKRGCFGRSLVSLNSRARASAEVSSGNTVMAPDERAAWFFSLALGSSISTSRGYLSRMFNCERRSKIRIWPVCARWESGPVSTISVSKLHPVTVGLGFQGA